MRPLPKFPLPRYGELMPRLPDICCCVVAGKLNVLACLHACMMISTPMSASKQRPKIPRSSHFLSLSYLR